jgi:hypothetical protein
VRARLKHVEPNVFGVFKFKIQNHIYIFILSFHVLDEDTLLPLSCSSDWLILPAAMHANMHGSPDVSGHQHVHPFICVFIPPVI